MFLVEFFTKLFITAREHDSFSYHAGWCVGKCVERTEKINTK